jgi:hypothetical protein
MFVTVIFLLLLTVLPRMDLVELENKPLQWPFDAGNKGRKTMNSEISRMEKPPCLHSDTHFESL